MRQIRRLFYSTLIAGCLYTVQLPTALAAGWTSGAEVQSMYSHAGVIVVVTNPQTGPVCNPGGIAGWFFWPTDTVLFPDHRDMHAPALSAYLTGKTIRFFANDADCFGPATGVTHALISN